MNNREDTVLDFVGKFLSTFTRQELLETFGLVHFEKNTVQPLHDSVQWTEKCPTLTTTCRIPKFLGDYGRVQLPPTEIPLGDGYFNPFLCRYCGGPLPDVPQTSQGLLQDFPGSGSFYDQRPARRAKAPDCDVRWEVVDDLED